MRVDKATRGGGASGKTTDYSSDSLPQEASSRNAFAHINEDFPPPPDTPGLDAAETEVAKQPDSSNARANLGYALYSAAAYAPALKAFDRALETPPGDARTQLYSGMSSMGIGDLEGAVKKLSSLAGRKDAPADIRSKAYLLVGNCRFRQKKEAAAKEAFAQSLTLDPKQGQAKLALGIFAAMEKKPDAARKYFSGAVDDLPSGEIRSRAYASLGLLAEKANNKPDALKNYQLALDDNPENAPARQGQERLSKK